MVLEITASFHPGFYSQSVPTLVSSPVQYLTYDTLWDGGRTPGAVLSAAGRHDGPAVTKGAAGAQVEHQGADGAVAAVRDQDIGRSHRRLVRALRRRRCREKTPTALPTVPA